MTTPEEDTPPQEQDPPNDVIDQDHQDDPVDTDAAVQDIALHAMQVVVEGTGDSAEPEAEADAVEVEVEVADADAGEGDNEEDADADVDGGNDNDNDNDNSATPKKKRLCRYPNCTRVIKSQGHCQRHGAKAKRCKVQGCDKQAQGTHDGMCKRHWKTIHFPQQPTTASQLPPPPQGESVYDGTLPQSISYRPTSMSKPPKKDDQNDPPPPPEGTNLMPLVAFLRQGAVKESGWHRNAERRARGLFLVTSLSIQLEPWERQLALVEILLLSGGTPYANFKDLAHAWGREKGFHHVLANSICERRGEVERKRRSDAGRSMSSEQREMFKQKLRRTKCKEDGDDDDPHPDYEDVNGDPEGEPQPPLPQLQLGDEDPDTTMTLVVDPVPQQLQLQQQHMQEQEQHEGITLMDATQEASV